MALVSGSRLMLKLAIATTLVVTLYSAFWLGQARGATGMLILAREEQAAIVADYEDALAHAQREYDALMGDNRRLQRNEEVLLERVQDAWATQEHLQRELDQTKAERDRYQSLAAFRGGESY